MSDVAVVTGATGGIGRWIAARLAQSGRRVVLVGRDAVRGEAALAWVREHAPGSAPMLELADLASLAQTRALAERLLSAHPAIGVLVNNAATFETRRVLTGEGHERVIAVNHLSPFVLTGALEPALRAAAPARIVTIGSTASDRARLDPDDLELRQGWGMLRAYGRSKLAVMMATFERARRLQGSGVTANVVHPGVVATGLVKGGPAGLAWQLIGRFSLTEAQGADTPSFVALEPGLAGTTATYFKRRRPVRANPQARDPAMLRRVWDATEVLTR